MLPDRPALLSPGVLPCRVYLDPEQPFALQQAQAHEPDHCRPDGQGYRPQRPRRENFYEKIMTYLVTTSAVGEPQGGYSTRSIGYSFGYS